MPKQDFASDLLPEPIIRFFYFAFTCARVTVMSMYLINFNRRKLS